MFMAGNTGKAPGPRRAQEVEEAGLLAGLAGGCCRPEWSSHRACGPARSKSLP